MYKDTRISLLACGCKQIELGGTVYQLDDSIEVSRGGSCLVYHAIRKDADKASRDRKVIIKEFYPFHKDSGNWRKEDGCLEFPENVEKITEKKKQFEHSYDRFTELYNTGMDNNTVKPEIFSRAGNSVYMVVEYSSGITLNAYMRECSLFDFFAVMQNLAGVLGALHGKGYIHMDVKPSNILCLATNPEHPKHRELTRLLDTDSFISKENFSKEIARYGLSGSPGYTAPEVIELSEDPDDFTLKEEIRINGERVDVFSFGAVIYEYIFEGELPEVSYEFCHSYEDRLEECLQKKSRYIPYKAISLIRELLRKTLAGDPYARYENMSEIGTEIEKILKLIDNKKPQILDNCSRNPDKILGREQKVLELRKKLTDPCLQQGSGRVVIVTGIGGIGKSSLAREYAAIYAEDYDVKAEVSAASAREAVQRIRFLNDPTDGIQNPNGIFEKRKEVIANLCAEYRTLLIVNDYDTSDEPDDIWKELGCDVILTSRHEWDNREYPTLTLSCNDLPLEKIREIFTSYYLQDIGRAERYNLEQMLQKEENELWSLLQYLNYHPLGIKLMARQMAFLPGQAILPAEMLDTLKKEGLRKDSLTEFQEKKESRTRYHNVYGHLVALYRAAFVNGRLQIGDRKALRYMTLVPSNMGISRKRFAQWTDLNAIHLQRLKRMGWLEYLPMQEDLLDGTKGRGVYVSVFPEDPEKSRQYETTKGTYVMPTVIQEVLRREPDLVCSVANCRKFVRSAIDSEGEKGFTAVRNALYEQRQLLRLLPEENSEEYAHLLMATAEPVLSDFMSYNADDYAQMLSMYQKSLEMMKALPDTYDFRQLCIARIIYCYASLGNFEAAYTLAAETIDERTKLGLGIDQFYLYQISSIYAMEFRAGEMKKAIGHMGQLLELHTQREASDLFGSASIYAELGQMLRKVGCWQQAEKMLLEADKRFIRLFYSEDGPLAIEMHNRMLVELGMLCLESMKNSWDANGLLYTALSLSKEFMQPTDLRVGDIHFYLAECWAKGNPHIRSAAFEQAAEHRKQALDIYQKQLHPGAFKTLLTKLLLALDYGEIPGMETIRDALLAECDAEIFFVAPEFLKGNPGSNLCELMQILARNAAAENRIPGMFEFLEKRRKLYLRLYGKDTGYLRECEALAKLCERYDLTEKAAHYRRITDWD